MCRHSCPHRDISLKSMVHGPSAVSGQPSKQLSARQQQQPLRVSLKAEGFTSLHLRDLLRSPTPTQTLARAAARTPACTTSHEQLQLTLLRATAPAPALVLRAYSFALIRRSLHGPGCFSSSQFFLRKPHLRKKNVMRALIRSNRNFSKVHRPFHARHSDAGGRRIVLHARHIR